MLLYNIYSHQKTYFLNTRIVGFLSLQNNTKSNVEVHGMCESVQPTNH